MAQTASRVLTAEQERDALRAEVERLRAALEQYGQHVRNCPAPDFTRAYRPCTCGFADALEMPD